MSIPESVINVANSVFPIFAFKEDSNGYSLNIIGTGFLFKRDLIFTAYHVMNDLKPNTKLLYGGKKLNRKISLEQINNEFQEIKLVVQDKERDFYIGEIKSHELLPINFNLNPTSDFIFESVVYMLGYPEASSTIYLTSEHEFDLSKVRMAVAYSKVVELIEFQNQGDYYNGYLLEKEILKGFSGGPCVDKNGGVIGISIMSLINKTTGQKNGVVNDYRIMGDLIIQANSPG